MPSGLLSLRRLLSVAVVGSILLAGGGGLFELWWLGPTTDATYARVVSAVEAEIERAVRSLEALALDLARHPDLPTLLARPSTQARLFTTVHDHMARHDEATLSVTVYDAAGQARAWAGRPSRAASAARFDQRAVFVSPGERDLTLVHVEPVPSSEDARPARSGGAVVAEWALSQVTGVFGESTDGFRLKTRIAGVTLRPPADPAVDRPYVFPLLFAGEPLLQAEVRPADLARARTGWRYAVMAAILVFLAGVILVATAPLMTRPPRGVDRAEVTTRAAAALAGVAAAYTLLRTATGVIPWDLRLLSASIVDPNALPALLTRPIDLLLLGLTGLALIAVIAFALEQLRLGGASTRGVQGRLTPGFPIAQLGGAGAATLLLVAFDRLVRDTFSGAGVDLFHTSLQPWDSGRLALILGVLTLAAAAFWGAALLLVSARLPWGNRPRGPGITTLVAAIWIGPGLVVASTGAVSPAATLPLLGGAVATALLVPYARPRVRHASHAARVLTTLGALLGPAVVAYPSLLHHGSETKRRIVETQYALQAANHSEELRAALDRTLDQLDQLVTHEPIAPPRSSSLPEAGPERAFALWRRTELAERRLTSSLELYAAGGSLISRFALNFPEYTSLPLERRVTTCAWDVFGEIAPFGSDERRVLHAERALCSPDDVPAGSPGDHAPGAMVVHVALDLRTLPFISSENPYTDLLGPSSGPGLHPVGHDVDLTVYGWGLQPVFSSSQDAWSIDEALFDRIYASREPFWTTLAKGGQTYATYILNDRVGIYAVGYPVPGLFEHLVHVAEIATLVGLLFVLLTLVTAAGSRLVPGRYRFGRALLREVRTSFYRRLFLAFIAATVIPVLALAFAIRSYVTGRLRADIEAGAARTAAVAQRVIEESVVLQEGGQMPATLLNDDVLVWISQILDQEVNIFRGSELAATSERDLFASGLLPTRTPAAVYAAVLLEHRPSFVMEDAIGSLEYLVAATPIRALGADAMLTVPLASRQQEIERQIVELDRGILLGVVLFVLLGAASGLSLAERIADPVKRLTRATGLIARGNFDTHVAARSADELQRLVVAFNQMADDLKRQQVQLEKTHRLEAWADMARQVAHEIKNPLTPVQLSAEHLLRVHADRGEPLGPVLRNCVNSILTQVRLLRQISSEFSSYATQPTVERQPSSLATLVAAVLEPYRVGLENRIGIVCDVDPTLPRLYLDRTLVSRALSNIVENALHAMPGRGSLTIRATADASNITLTVTDTGVGLDPDTLRRIFEPYFSTRVSGTGLGMAIAKRNIELNDGTIAVASRKDEGTTVTIRFRRPTGSADETTRSSV